MFGSSVGQNTAVKGSKIEQFYYCIFFGRPCTYMIWIWTNSIYFLMIWRAYIYAERLTWKRQTGLSEECKCKAWCQIYHFLHHISYTIHVKYIIIIISMIHESSPSSPSLLLSSSYPSPSSLAADMFSFGFDTFVLFILINTFILLIFITFLYVQFGVG